MDDPVLCPVQQPLSMLEDKYKVPGEPEWRIHPANPCNAVVVYPDATLRVSHEDNGVTARKLERNVAYDRYGNVTLVEDQDDVDDPADDVLVAVRYAAVGPAYLADFLEHLEVRHNGNLLRSRSATFDARGNLLEHRAWHDDGVLLTRYGFDDVGNLRAKSRPPPAGSSRWTMTPRVPSQRRSGMTILGWYPGRNGTCVGASPPEPRTPTAR